MPAPSNIKEYLELLEKSNLLQPSQVQKAHQKYNSAGGDPGNIATFADFLMQENLITKFHADQLANGRHKGFMVGKYKILRLIGSGGMGRVYLAEHTIMRRQVALKILPKAKGADPSALGRFQREARAVAALNHPNIVQAYDIDQDGDLHYMVMEFIEGKSVQEYVKAFGPAPWPIAADFICQSASGLQHASESGLVHRDIKPGNVLVDSNGVIKLLDMGLAVFFTEKDVDSLTVTFNENVLGTADYLAPEQALDSHNVDIRADIYGLGGTFYYLLTGSPPFPEGTIAQKLLWHQSKEPRSIKELVPDLPDGLVEIIKKMLAKKASNRYTTPAELEVALRPYSVRVDRPFDQEAVRAAIAAAKGIEIRVPRKTGSGETKIPTKDGSSPRRVTPAEQKSPTAESHFGGDDPTPRDNQQAAQAGELPWFAKEEPAAPAAPAPSSPSTDTNKRRPPPKKKSDVAPAPSKIAAKQRTSAGESGGAAAAPPRKQSPTPMSKPASWKKPAEDVPFFVQAAEDKGRSAGAAVADKSSDESAATDDSADMVNSVGSSIDRTGGSSKKAANASAKRVGASSKQKLASRSGVIDDDEGPQSGANKWVIPAAIVGGVVVIGLVAFFALRPDSPDVPVTDVKGKFEDTKPEIVRDPAKYLVVPTEEMPELMDALYSADKGQIVEIKKGTVLDVRNTLEISPNKIDNKSTVSVAGEGPGVVLRAETKLPLFIVTETEQFTIKDLTIDGNGLTGPVIEIIGPKVTGFTLENVTLRNFRGAGIRMNYVDGTADAPITLKNVTVEISDGIGSAVVIGSGLPLDPADLRSSQNIQIIGCKFTSGVPLAPGVEPRIGSGIEIAQRFGSIQVSGTTISNGKAGILIGAAPGDWRTLKLTDVVMENVLIGIDAKAYQYALQQIDKGNTKFVNVGTQTDPAVPAATTPPKAAATPSTTIAPTKAAVPSATPAPAPAAPAPAPPATKLPPATTPPPAAPASKPMITDKPATDPIQPGGAGKKKPNPFD